MRRSSRAAIGRTPNAMKAAITKIEIVRGMWRANQIATMSSATAPDDRARLGGRDRALQGLAQQTPFGQVPAARVETPRRVVLFGDH